MPYLILAAATIFMSCNGIGATLYNRKNSSFKETAKLYNLLILGTVFICWLIKFLTNPMFDFTVIIYSLVFTVGYTTAMLSSICAYREGPMMLSSLIMQLSMISTTVWGFFFWGSEITAPVIAGVFLVIAALMLCLYTGKVEVGEKKRISAKWLLFVSLFFVGNSVGTITQRTQQLDFDSAYGDFFMTVATGVSFAVCLFVYLKSDKTDTKKILEGSWYIPLLCGAFNFFQNLFVIILATLLSANIVYPVLMIGSLAVTGIYSIVIFKERMNWWQWLGVILGAIAIALLC